MRRAPLRVRRRLAGRPERRQRRRRRRRRRCHGRLERGPLPDGGGATDAVSIPPPVDDADTPNTYAGPGGPWIAFIEPLRQLRHLPRARRRHRRPRDCAGSRQRSLPHVVSRRDPRCLRDRRQRRGPVRDLGRRRRQRWDCAARDGRLRRGVAGVVTRRRTDCVQRPGRPLSRSRVGRNVDPAHDRRLPQPRGPGRPTGSASTSPATARAAEATSGRSRWATAASRR